MRIAETYTLLSRIIGYPTEKDVLQAGSEAVSKSLRKRGIPCPLSPFAEFVASSTLAALQEDYVATFDFNPAVALYLGHHLYGDNQKKGLYLIGLKQEFRRSGFTPSGNELPDHLPLVFQFLAHLAQHEEGEMRQAFISDSVLPGIEGLVAGFAGRHSSPWKSLVEASRLFCSTDAAAQKEVRPC